MIVKLLYLLVRSTGKPEKVIKIGKKREEYYFFDFGIKQWMIKATFTEK